MIRYLMCFSFLCISQVGAAQSPKLKKISYKRIAILSEVLDEVSGIYIQEDGNILAHNDSGDDANLYCLGKDFAVVDTVQIKGAKNIDWEAITHDNKGNLFVCDIGNNQNKRRDLVIYRYNMESGGVGKINFSYADQIAFPPDKREQNFDAEACIWYRDSLYIFSKNRIGAGDYVTTLYVLPDKPGTYSARVKERLNLRNRVITDASLSPDENRLVLLGYDLKKRPMRLVASLFVLYDFEKGDFFSGQIKRFRLPKIGFGKQFEAIDFIDNTSLIVASEKTPINRAFFARVKLILK